MTKTTKENLKAFFKEPRTWICIFGCVLLFASVDVFEHNHLGDQNSLTLALWLFIGADVCLCGIWID